MRPKLATKIFFSAAIAYAVALLTVSLIKVDTGSSPVQFEHMDKVFHFGAYVGLTLLWQIYYFIKNRIFHPQPSLWICILAVIFGIIIEILQGTATTYRGFEFLDIVANTLGVLVAYVILTAYNPLSKVIHSEK